MQVFKLTFHIKGEPIDCYFKDQQTAESVYGFTMQALNKKGKKSIKVEATAIEVLDRNTAIQQLAEVFGLTDSDMINDLLKQQPTP